MIPFNKPFLSGKEIDYILDAASSGQLAGDGKCTQLCQKILTSYVGSKTTLLTHSCTAALEMCALLGEFNPGDEVIMPSFTFVSTANAFCLRGLVPVFVDIREDTLNLNEQLIEDAINEKTKAIVAVHYAGVSCEMNYLVDLCKRKNLLLIEDAAQSLGSKYENKPLGSFGDLSTLSFHETKNIISGEGGALLINNDSFTKSAEIIREKGTDRKSFSRGEKSKYTWQSLGSSYLPGELIAAFLYAQLKKIKEITHEKLIIWNNYFNGLTELEDKGIARLPVIPSNCIHNGHLFYILLENERVRNSLIENLRENQIHSVFHYVPLHSSPAGIKMTKTHGKLEVTESCSSRLLRLPSWIGMNATNNIIDKLLYFLTK